MVSSSRRRMVGVIFGSRSMEHGVSVLTAWQAIQALDHGKYDVTPIYISERGEWLASDHIDDVSRFKGLPLDAGEFERAFRVHARPAAIVPDPRVGGLMSLEPGGGLLKRRSERTPLDVVLLTLHGPHGEDGTIQGLLELAGLPYTGSGVLGSALSMDKVAMKDIWRAGGLPVVPSVAFSRARWEQEREALLDQITDELSYPIFVKPASLGSSIGISRAINREDLGFAIDVAASYDRRVIIEQGIEDAVDINCAVLGNDELTVSICERPVVRSDFLTYEDKYLHGKLGKRGGGQGMEGMARQLPAQIPAEQAARVQELARNGYRLLDCAGMARVDTLVRPSGEVYLNEINSLPGSLAYYLWEASGITYPHLLDRLLDLAVERARDKERTRFSSAGA